MENFLLCRICTSESNVMMSIFGKDALWKKISSFANVQIEEGDNLPQQICAICARSAVNAFLFKEKCEEADRFFRGQLRAKLECPDLNGDVITLSSDEEHINIKEEKVFEKYRSDIMMLDRMKSSPNAPEDSMPISENEFNWADNQSMDHDDCDDTLPLIPEIELITSSDDLRISVYGYQCSICFESFSMKSILKHHVKHKHPEANPTFECFECKKTYLSKRFLDKHIRRGRCVKKRKNQSRVMECADCHNVFPSGHHLGWHKRAGTCPAQRRGNSNNFTPIPLKGNHSETDEDCNDEISLEEKFSAKNTKRKSKRKGRGRIVLNSNQIALAKQLIEQDVSTSVMADKLHISRTYAWKLRKSLCYMSSQNQSNDNHINGTDVQSEAQGRIRVKAFAGKQVDTDDAESEIYSCNKGLGNGESNLHEESDDKESRHADEDEETESADESRQDENIYMNSTSSIQPSCSQDTQPLDVASSSFFTSTPDINVSNDASKTSSGDPPYRRKPRKPNVFMDAQKYEEAKQLVEKRATTMEVAKHLNISQMSAWKLRDNILKGIPMSFKPPPTPRSRESTPKVPFSRPKLKGAQRRERDRRITEEILSMIKEDKSIQYWRVSQKLAEKGLHLSASSVCQRLKAMGFHRRTKNGDSPPNDAIKSTTSAGEDDNSSSLYGTTDTSHFLSTSFSNIS